MDARSARPMIAKDLGLALDFIDKAKTARTAVARRTLLVSAEEAIHMAARAMGTRPGEKAFTWTLPAGRSKVTYGLTAIEAAQKLGTVVGWVDDDTVTVRLGEVTMEAKLQAVRG